MKLIIASIILGGSIIFATFLYTNNHKSEVIEKDYLFNIEPIEKDNPFNVTKLGCTSQDDIFPDKYNHLFLRIDDARKKLRINMGNELDFNKTTSGNVYIYQSKKEITKSDHYSFLSYSNNVLKTTQFGNSIEWSCELID